MAAVSGGSDSVALLFVLHDLHLRGDLVLDSVAHLNHEIRPEADSDESFCRALAQRLDVPLVAGRSDVPHLARTEKRSLEVAGREARREFLNEVLANRGADCVAIAHTEDDQAETVLLRILRGSGLRGLGGIAPVGDRRIRPLLELTRVELQHELRSRGETWREDSTNADLTNPRNRVRHELLPYLQQRFNPSVNRSIARLADVARADDAWIAAAAADAAASVVRPTPKGVGIDSARLNGLSVAIARRVVQRTLEAVRGDAGASLEDIEQVRAVASGQQAVAEISGARVEHSDASVVLISRDTAVAAPAGFHFDLPIPGTLDFARMGWAIDVSAPQPHPSQSVGLETNAAKSTDGAGSTVVQIDAAGIGDRLLVRSRRPGDRIRPLGLGGGKRKKVQDVFVDRKVSRMDRDTIPIVTDAQGRIVWVAGHVLSDEFRVSEDTKAVIILRLRRI